MIVAGFGFRGQATAESLAAALRATGYAGQVDRIATAHDKAQHPAFLDFAEAQDVKIQGIASDVMELAQTVTQSHISQEIRRTGSVAEAAAIAAAGPGATLIVSRRISKDRMATCAIAEGPDT